MSEYLQIRDKLNKFNKKYSNKDYDICITNMDSYLLLMDMNHPNAWYSTMLLNFPYTQGFSKRRNAPLVVKKMWDKFCQDYKREPVLLK